MANHKSLCKQMAGVSVKNEEKAFYSNNKKGGYYQQQNKKSRKSNEKLRTEKMAPTLNMGEVLGQGEFNQTVTQMRNDSLDLDDMT